MKRLCAALVALAAYAPQYALVAEAAAVPPIPTAHGASPRERVRLHDGWRFSRTETISDHITYDSRPDIDEDEDIEFLKPWILPSANRFIKDPADQYETPSEDVPIVPVYAQLAYNDSAWETVQVPHDWAIAGPFYTGDDPAVSPDMGRLPVQGVGWYRRTLDFAKDDDLDKTFVLEVDGAMSYPMVWLNGQLVGGWAYGYASFQVDLTPHVKPGPNQLAIRVENPAEDFSRWYPGAGLYRNVWLTKLDHPVHVAQWGTNVTTADVSADSATVHFSVDVENTSADDRDDITVSTSIHELSGGIVGNLVAEIPARRLAVLASSDMQSVSGSAVVPDPRLWGPPPEQQPNRYIAVTQLWGGGGNGTVLLDTYTTKFGIRSLAVDPSSGQLFINNQSTYFQGVNQHHDLGALGAAFHVGAARRQLDILRDLGVNAIRMAHNPPDPQLLDLTDEMGFLVVDEIFDVWREGKDDCDFSLIFDDWSEADLRAFIRRDRHHQSVVMWSFGNEVVEQTDPDGDAAAAEMAQRLGGIVREEDDPAASGRLSMASIFRTGPESRFAGALDVVALNYLGEGTRYGPGYEHLEGYRRDPQYGPFHDAQPEKLIFGSEVAWSLSSRGSYLFPVTNLSSAPVNDTNGGGDSETREISAYELYSSDSGSSPDKVMYTQDTHDFVAGGFVWAGWDYLGETYPYDDARSAYSGIVDLAGFPKDRFYLYQARWRPDLPMAHIVPQHWSWPDSRVGEVTPVHVFSTGDEAELFVNGESQGGRLQREPLTYRFRWDDVVFRPGEVKVVTYKDGEPWAVDVVQTAGEPSQLRVKADRREIAADDGNGDGGEDMAFVTVEVCDRRGRVVPDADNLLEFSVSGGGGTLVATDNGFQADFVAFPSPQRKAYHGLAMGIVKASKMNGGPMSDEQYIDVAVESEGLRGAAIRLPVV